MAIIMQSASIASLVYTRRAMGVPPGVASLTTLAANLVIEQNEALQALNAELTERIAALNACTDCRTGGRARGWGMETQARRGTVNILVLHSKAPPPWVQKIHFRTTPKDLSTAGCGASPLACVLF